MLFFECRPDFVLVKSLTNIPKRECIHEFKGKSGICERLERNRNSKGLIDEDPLSIQPPYIQRLRLESDLPEHGLKVLKDSSRNNQVVILRPRLEEWVLQAAREGNIDVRRYELPDEAGRLHRHINIMLDNFERLIEELKNMERLRALRRLLERG